MSKLELLNNNGEKQVKNYIYVNYGKKLATTKAQVLLDKEEPKGLSMMFDLFSSLGSNKCKFKIKCPKRYTIFI